MELIPAHRQELERVQDIYWTLLDSSPEYEATLRWRKNIYPSQRDWLHYIDRNEMYFLAENGQILGAVVLSDEQAEAYRAVRWSASLSDGEVTVVHLFALLPEHQGKGYAGKALETIAAFSRTAKKKAIRLDAVATNLHAQRLYENFGFRFCGKEKLYYESTGLTDFLFYDYLL